jgi:hypothetical protein
MSDSRHDPYDSGVQSEVIADAKLVIYEGMEKAVALGDVSGDQIGVLVDEQFGCPSISRRRQWGSGSS